MPHSKKRNTFKCYYEPYHDICNGRTERVREKRSIQRRGMARLAQAAPVGVRGWYICDMAVCTPLSRKLVAAVTGENDRECFKGLILRFSMVVLMTVAMTVFSVVVTWEDAQSAVSGFFRYLPYNFTIALPVQMLVVAPVSLRLARAIAKA